MQLMNFIISSKGDSVISSALATILTIGLNIVNNASFYPEGPLFNDKKDLLYVEYATSKVMIWDGNKNTLFWEKKGCGPAALIQRSNQNYLVTCYDANSIVELSPTGQLIQEIVKDDQGESFKGPNDLTMDSDGNIYLSMSGVFDSAAPIEGSIYRLDNQNKLAKLAEGLHYPNGIAVMNQNLLVNEHLGKKITSFTITNNGSLTKSATLVDLTTLGLKIDKEDDYTGPDGLKLDDQNRLFVAHYGAGRVLVLSPDGSLLKEIPVAEAYVTNIAFDADYKRLAVTAAEDAWKAPYPGKVYILKDF